jgi:hypothetical protein
MNPSDVDSILRIGLFLVRYPAADDHRSKSECAVTSTDLTDEGVTEEIKLTVRLVFLLEPGEVMSLSQESDLQRTIIFRVLHVTNHCLTLIFTTVCYLRGKSPEPVCFVEETLGMLIVPTARVGV